MAIKVIETHVDNMETETCGHLVIWSFGHFQKNETVSFGL